MPRCLFVRKVCTQANSIADLLTNKLKSFKFGILFLDCVETDHEMAFRLNLQNCSLGTCNYGNRYGDTTRRDFLAELVDFQKNWGGCLPSPPRTVRLCFQPTNKNFPRFSQSLPHRVSTEWKDYWERDWVSGL